MTNGIVIGLSALAGVWLGWFAVPVTFAVVALVLLIEGNRSRSLLLACVVFASLGGWRSAQPDGHPTSTLLATSTGAVGVVDSFPRPSGDGHRVILSVSELCIGSQCIPADETVVLFVGQPQSPIARGDVVRVEWRIESLHQLPTGYRQFVQSRNATASARADVVHRLNAGPAVFQRLATVNQSLSHRLAAQLPGDTGALAAGIVTGDDSGLSDSAMDQFRSTGTAHITAVSGQNVTIILGFLSLWWRPQRTKTRVLYHVGLVLIVWSYALMVGLEPPALRAAIVASLTILGSHVGRRPDPVTLLALTLGGMALLQPMMVHGIGFWLSACASLALCLALPYQLAQRPQRMFLQIVSGPVVASLATMPIVLMAFGTWSPVSILANILIAPTVTFAFWVTYPFALVALTVPGLAGLLAWIPGIALGLVLLIVEWLAPLAGQIRVDSLSPWGMLALMLPVGMAIWLISGESERWIRLWHRKLSRLRKNDVEV